MAGVECKSPREIGLMREAGLIVAEAHALARTMMRPGVVTLEINDAIDSMIRERGGVPTFLGQYDFPRSVCMSINEEVVHGIPGDRVLQDGDVVSIDIGCTKRKFIADSAWTYGVGNVSEPVKRLLKDGEESLMAGLRAIRSGGKVGDISRAIQEYAESRGYGVVREYTGHGVGRELHEPPQIPNYVARLDRNKHVPLNTGMTLAVEPMINLGTHRVTRLDDGWTVVTEDRKPSVHFEHTVAVTEEGALILTAQPGQDRILLDSAVGGEPK